MGLAASQARLLSITARLSDNELHSQQISNSKVRLADKTQEASQEYIQALNATKLMYTSYNSDGGVTQTELTAGIMYEYGDAKNQYGISNTSGQLLVNGKDAMNFEASDTVNDFVQMYGVELTDNPQFILDLQSIYGSNYEDYFNMDTEKPVTDLADKGLASWITSANSGMTEEEYNSWASSLDIPVLGKESGSYGNLISAVTNVPAYPGDEPVKPVAIVAPDFGDLATAYNNSVCYTSVKATDSGIGHMEHNLAALLWYTNGLGTDTGTITNSDGTITITNKDDKFNTDYGFSLTNYDFGDPGQAAPLLEAFREAAEYQSVQDLMQSVIDLYCDVVNYLHKNNLVASSGTTKLESGAYEISSSEPTKSADDLVKAWEQFYDDLATLKGKVDAEIEEQNKILNEIYNQELTDWKGDWEYIKEWQNTCTELYNEYLDDLDNLPSSKIPDEEDPKTSWYVNLWHRMNGASDRKSIEGEKGTYYKQLDDNLLSSSEWLQFALEHGVVTLEKVQYVDESEEDTGLKTTQWMATTYSSCTDISTTEDEIAIARAETEYNQKLREIESKDKKYDNDLKKLDTEHNALQTEYESVKSVIEKNTERSFKAFS